MLGSILIWLTESLGTIGTFLLSLVIFLVILMPGGRPKNFPPGMPMLPVLGSLPFTRGSITRTMITSLKKKYGDMASFAIFNTRVVLISNLKTIKEVFSQAKASGRPDLMALKARNSLLTEGRHTHVGIISTQGELWHEQRRFVLRHLRDLGFGKTSLEPLMAHELTELLDHIAMQKDQPISMQRIFNRSIINVIWGMVMGKRYAYDDKKLALLMKNFVVPAEVSFLSPIHFIPGMHKVAHYMPFLQKEIKPLLNVAAFVKNELDEFRREEREKESDCLTALFIRQVEENKGKPSFFHLDQLVGVIFDMFIAGSETTASTLSMGINLMAKHPEIQKRVHEELDNVVGRDQTPSFDRMDQLPYTQATIHEIQRVFELIPFSLPHTAMEDMSISGYSIPKGTILLGNMEDCMMDPTLWRNPKTFDPRNFLDDEGKYKRNEAFLPFGSGKRQCVGEPLARLELFLFFSGVMQRFHFYDIEEEVIHNDNPFFTAPPKYTVKARARF